MTKEEIIAMARDAGVIATKIDGIERFAALVAAAERNRTWTQDHWTEYERSIAAHEREACAKVVEASPSYDWHKFACEAAAAIRARGE